MSLRPTSRLWVTSCHSVEKSICWARPRTFSTTRICSDESDSRVPPPPPPPPPPAASTSGTASTRSLLHRLEMARSSSSNTSNTSPPPSPSRSSLLDIYAPHARPPSRTTPGLNSRATAAQSVFGRALNPSQIDPDAAAATANAEWAAALELATAPTRANALLGLVEPYHFHIYGHKHNTHITVTKPDRNAIISMSAGQIGFRKARRGTYDAAYQLTGYVIDKLHQGNWHKKIYALEVVLRGFGFAREASVKALLGNEGKLLREAIVKVSDDTKLKFGGARSKKPRRLG